MRSHVAVVCVVHSIKQAHGVLDFVLKALVRVLGVQELPLTVAVHPAQLIPFVWVFRWGNSGIIGSIFWDIDSKKIET